LRRKYSGGFGFHCRYGPCGSVVLRWRSCVLLSTLEIQRPAWTARPAVSVRFFVCLTVCMSVCLPSEKKRFELSVEIQFMAGPRHAPTLRSKGQDQDLCYDYRLRWITAGMSIRLHYLKLFSVSYLQRRTTVCSMRALVYLLTVVLSGCVVLQGGPSLVDGCP